VRFDIEERFKGVASELHQIWVDPGSFTSCYEDYRMGERYLIFATRRAESPNDTVAMTVMRNGDGQSKPVPPGFDLANHPPVYYVPNAPVLALRSTRALTRTWRCYGHIGQGQRCLEFSGTSISTLFAAGLN
jgi:hypothetical protein